MELQKIDDCRWRIPREGKMRTEGLIYADERLFADIRKDQSLVQVANVAWLPGIVGHSLAMPDIHWGYGFPIGGVPPVGHDQPLRTFVDQAFLAFDEIWAAAGTPNAVFRIAPSDLICVTGGEVVSLT